MANDDATRASFVRFGSVRKIQGETVCSDIFDFQSVVVAVVVVGSLTRKSQAEIPFAVGGVGKELLLLLFFYLFNKISAAPWRILIAHSAKYFQIM